MHSLTPRFYPDQELSVTTSTLREDLCLYKNFLNKELTDDGSFLKGSTIREALHQYHDLVADGMYLQALRFGKALEKYEEPAPTTENPKGTIRLESCTKFVDDIISLEEFRFADSALVQQSLASPSCKNRVADTEVDIIVLHSTVENSIEDVMGKRFSKRDEFASSHYTIDKDGTIYQHVAENMWAYHAGVSEMPDGRKNINPFSIGVELINLNDGEDPYTDAQRESLDKLLADIITRHPIKYIVSHAEIAPGRKSDPKGLDLEPIKARAFTGR